MADFLEERLSDLIRYGSGWQDDFTVDIVSTSGGAEYRRLVQPLPVRRFDISYLLDSARTWSELLAVYYRAHGQFAGFRARCYDEWSSNGAIAAPTAFDQETLYVSDGVYQLKKTYGTNKAAGATGYAYRLIKKPVAGTVKVGIGAAEVLVGWSVATASGLITFSADQTASVAGITNAAAAVVTFTAPHPFVVGQALHFASVTGMTQINGLRGRITANDATTATLALDTSAFGTYTSGGAVHTRPQTGEPVTAGYEFDFPVRFASALPIGQDYPGYRPVDGVQLIELLNP